MRIVLKGVLLLSCLLFVNCFGFNSRTDDFSTPIRNYKPIIMNRTAFENSIETLPVQAVQKSGKIYIFDQFMFVNDVNLGFHVYDYSNPTSPIAIKFLKIPGATDLAIRNSKLYINQAVDLVTMYFDSQALTFSVLYRNKDVFPQKNSPDGFQSYVEPNDIIINWIPN